MACAFDKLSQTVMRFYVFVKSLLSIWSNPVFASLWGRFSSIYVIHIIRRHKILRIEMKDK